MRSHPGDIKRANAREEAKVKLVRVQKALEAAGLALFEAERLAKTVNEGREVALLVLLDDARDTVAVVSRNVSNLLEDQR
jgi:hypothetical protein